LPFAPPTRLPGASTSPLLFRNENDAAYDWVYQPATLPERRSVRSAGCGYEALQLGLVKLDE